jgi:hypothetical protein
VVLTIFTGIKKEKVPGKLFKMYDFRAGMETCPYESMYSRSWDSLGFGASFQT